MKRNIFFIVLIVSIAVFSACKKDKTPVNVNGTQLEFTSLTASDDSIIVGAFATFTATAKGDELIYRWSSDWGAFIGSGSSVQWSGCHAAVHIINCEVKDKYGASIKKSVSIVLHDK